MVEEPKTWLVPEQHKGDLVYIADHVRSVVRLKAKRDIEAGASGIQEFPWFVEKHLYVVEDRADWIIENCEEAEGVNRNEATIAVWTHDLGRLMGWDYSHDAVSAFKTKKWLLDNGLEEEVADRIFKANIKHRAKGERLPETPLEKVIASADALSHFDGCETESVRGFIDKKGFWYLLWKKSIKDGAPDEEILKRSFKKMERDAGSKQGFRESRERALKEFEFLKNNAENILIQIRNESSNLESE